LPSWPVGGGLPACGVGATVGSSRCRESPRWRSSSPTTIPGVGWTSSGADGLDRAYVALSSPLGIEALPPDAARPLLDAWHDGAGALPAELGAWAAPSVSEPDPDHLAGLLDRGVVGACLPAEALASATGFDRCGSLLELLDARGAPLLVHPGPGPDTLRVPAIDRATAAVPSWWPALTRTWRR
jgi:6-methylsalicylate decarboxylase